MEELKPLISVMMACYKEDLAVLSSAIESIRNQTYSNFEFFIVSDNPDNEVHHKLLQDYEKKDARIHLLYNEKNMGLSQTLNHALRHVTTPYVVKMDADDWSYPDRLEKQLNYIQCGNFDLIGGLTDVIDENGDMLYSVSKLASDPEKVRKSLKYGPNLPSPAWMGKTELFSELNGFREVPYAEDYDFMIRAVLRGKRLSNLNEPVLKYRMTSASISRQNLYPQYLVMRELSRQYAKGFETDPETLPKTAGQSASRRYQKANGYFQNALKALENRKFFACAGNCVKILVSSPSFVDKIRRTLAMQLAAL